MDENKVIDCLCIYLVSKGWKIVSRVVAGCPGIDIVAVAPSGKTFYVEAKGNSSRSGSPRFGRAYTDTQVFDVTSKGLMQSFHHIVKDGPTVGVAFAYPAGKYFSKYIDPIVPLLKNIGLTLFRVNEDGTVDDIE